jgi:hypothetical protein
VQYRNFRAVMMMPLVKTLVDRSADSIPKYALYLAMVPTAPPHSTPFSVHPQSQQVTAGQ